MAFFLISSCTTLSVPAGSGNFSTKNWPQRRHALQQIKSWNISGAFSVQQDGESTIANYTWQQKNQNYQIDIHSSLGLYSLTMTGTPDSAVLQESGHQTIHASSADQLLYQRLGWRLPVTNLRYWIRGLPAPGTHRDHFDAWNHLSQVEQQGWQVTFGNYTTIKKTDLPQMLNIRGHGIRIRIAIKQWGI